MRKVERLQREARQAAHNRGHKLRPFMQSISNPKIYATDCRHCDMLVSVNVNPAPNEIDIGGQAVAMNCTVKPNK